MVVCLSQCMSLLREGGRFRGFGPFLAQHCWWLGFEIWCSGCALVAFCKMTEMSPHAVNVEGWCRKLCILCYLGVLRYLAICLCSHGETVHDCGWLTSALVKLTVTIDRVHDDRTYIWMLFMCHFQFILIIYHFLCSLQLARLVPWIEYFSGWRWGRILCMYSLSGPSVSAGPEQNAGQGMTQWWTGNLACTWFELSSVLKV